MSLATYFPRLFLDSVFRLTRLHSLDYLVMLLFSSI
jgi:hypothetical protein